MFHHFSQLPGSKWESEYREGLLVPAGGEGGRGDYPRVGRRLGGTHVECEVPKKRTLTYGSSDRPTFSQGQHHAQDRGFGRGEVSLLGNRSGLPTQGQGGHLVTLT
eukprot:951102-Amorphochlora_amoeboformis.AAC.1